MKLFIWEYLDGLTGEYHDGGGAVVIAPTLDSAVTLLVREAYALVREDVPEPDRVVKVDVAAEPEVFIFEGSGCC